VTRYLLRRAFHSLLVLVGVSVLVFGLLYLAPADPAQVIAAQRTGGPPSPADLAYVREIHGLDQPLVVQYGRWLGQTVRGDLGHSIRTGRPIAEELREPLRHTFLLGGITLLVVILSGIPIGIAEALRPGAWWVELLRLGALAALSVPSFWLAFGLILLFAIHLQWLPSFGAKGTIHLVLPVTTLAVAHAASLSRLTRALLQEQMARPYVRTARAKGLAPLPLMWRHVMPTVAVPLVTVLAAQGSSLLGGAIIIEAVFSWPGLGQYYLSAVHYRDIPVIQAVVLIFGLLILGANLLADLSYGIFDPRIRLDG
jgi:ABC-type dipeptide/oligopeptide/nickel transport system permease component